MRILTFSFIAMLLGSQSVHAYMTPTEVFPDLNVPQQQSSSAAQQDMQAEEDAAATQSSYGLPTFYRGGEQIEQNKVYVPEPRESDENIFEEPTPSSSDEETSSSESSSSEPTDEELLQQEMDEQEADTGSEGEESEEETKPAAKRESMLITLMRQMKYLVGAIGLGAAAFFYWTMSKKKPATGGSSGIPLKPASDVPQAPTGQMVEESSERLEHALKAISNENATQGEEDKE